MSWKGTRRTALGDGIRATRPRLAAALSNNEALAPLLDQAARTRSGGGGADTLGQVMSELNQADDGMGGTVVHFSA